MRSSRRRRYLQRRFFAALLGVLIAPGAIAQPGFPAWVGIYSQSQPGWLENENRISELCGASPDPSSCYTQMLKPAVAVHDLRSEPDASSSRVGTLIVVAVPGRGLSAWFSPTDSGEAIPVVPDLFLQDWGYGPHFHQTFTRRQNDWFQLPSDPWETPVWLHRPDERQQSSIIDVQAGDIIELRGSGMYVVEAEADALSLRPEQPADSWCEEGDPPLLIDEAPIRMTREELVDSNGHLLFVPKYLKGC